MNKLLIGIDFDGTCVTHDYPRVGKEIGAVPVLTEITNKGHLLILNTMRSGPELEDAVNWFHLNNLKLYGVNKNPTQDSWTSSPKVYAHLYIDDAALGAPLKEDSKLSSRKFVDWTKAEAMLKELNII